MQLEDRYIFLMGMLINICFVFFFNSSILCLIYYMEYLGKYFKEKYKERTYLSEHHHVMHHEGDVEEWGEAVDEVELGTKNDEEWRMMMMMTQLSLRREYRATEKTKSKRKNKC